MDSVREDRRYRFGTFEFDAVLPELRRSGRKVRLRPQPLTLLSLLVSRPGELVSRDEIQAALWGTETFIDFEQGVNHCIKQLRTGLGDSADSPRFIETVPRRGYRFIAPIQRVPPTDSTPLAARPATPAADHPGTTGTVQAPGTPRGLGAIVAVLAFAVGGLAVGLALLVTWEHNVRPARAGTAAPTIVAVLPFEFTGGDAAVGVGLSHAISTRLAAQNVAVRTPRSESGTRPALPAAIETGRLAGATSVLTGSLARSGGAVVVLAVLTDIESGSETWSGRFRVQTAELFSAENVIAQRVVDALQLRIASSEQQRLRRRYTGNAAAYEAYLRGRAALVEYTPASTLRAVTAFQAALGQDSNYALARAGLAMACADMYLRYAKPGDVDRWGTCAEQEARTALDADANLAEAHLARAMVTRKREFDWSGAIAASQRALILNDNLEQAHFIIAAAYYHLGFMEEALIELERGRRLHGLDVVEPMRIEALVALFSGNFAAARARLEDVSRRSSQAIGDTYLALAYYYTGHRERARAMLEALAQSGSASTAARAGAALAAVLAAAGDRAAARASVERVLASEYRDHHVAYGLGAAYAQLGRSDEAVRWLGMAADTGFPCVTWFERDPLLDAIRQQSTFATVMERVRVQRQAALSRLDTLGG